MLPEVDYDINTICETLKNDRIKGKMTRIIIVSEGAAKGADIARQIEEKTGFDTKGVVLGYIQRGGTPSAFDRIIATKMSVESR